jgi:hypothetical protein
VDGQMTQLLLQPPVLALDISPPADENAVNPAFQHGRHRPPVDRIDQHQRIGAIDARLLGERIGWRYCTIRQHCHIGRAEAGIEAFGGQVGDFDGMPKGVYLLCDASCDRMGH